MTLSLRQGKFNLGTRVTTTIRRFDMEAVKAVVWPYGQVQISGEPIVYKYAIVGVLLTDQPIESFEGKNDVVLRGQSFGLSDALSHIQQVKPQIKIGDANQVLGQLDLITEER
jgi:hypothetical protein